MLCLLVSCPRRLAASSSVRERLALETTFYPCRYVTPGRTSQLSEEQLDSFFAATVSSLWSSYSANVLSVVRQAQEQALANILKAVLPSGKDKPGSSVLDAGTAYKRISAFLQRQGSSADVSSPKEFARQYSATPHLQAVASYIDKVERG